MARQCPHVGLPNSSIKGPVSLSTSAREGSIDAYVSFIAMWMQAAYYSVAARISRRLQNEAGSSWKQILRLPTILRAWALRRVGKDEQDGSAYICIPAIT